MAILRLFGPARQAAGVPYVMVEGESVGAILSDAEIQFGLAFSDVLRISKVWLNGETVDFDTAVTNDDEVAVIPPVSGG